MTSDTPDYAGLCERLRHEADTMCPGQYYDGALNLAADAIEALLARESQLRETQDKLMMAVDCLKTIRMGAKLYWREGDHAYQFAILSEEALADIGDAV